MDKKQTEHIISSIEQKIQAKFDEGFNLLSRYENVELNEKELRKVNFQMDSLKIDINILKKESSTIKKLQNGLNKINKELQEQNNTLLQQLDNYYNLKFPLVFLYKKIILIKNTTNYKLQ